VIAASITTADLGSSLRAFLAAAGQFFQNLAAIHWAPFALALLLLAAMSLARARAWFNALRAAYPQTKISYPELAGAYLAGAGINAVIPAHVGDASKVVLAKRLIRGSSYPAVTSSFLVQTIFDTTAGVLVIVYALTQGLLPRPPRLPDLAAFDISFWAQHPQVLVFTLTALGIGFLVLFAVLARHVERFWDRVKQGVVILTRPRDYLRLVVSWQSVGWLCRFGAFWYFLEAFGIGGTIANVMLVMSVQSISNAIPLTPGGAGAQQALLVATLEGPSRASVLSFSVGTQIAMAVWAALLGFVALILVFRTTDWRGLVKQAQDEKTESAAAEEEAEPADAAAQPG
jgi:uncharacterized membrane protein YbhN (UPF0104 family)